MTRADSMERGVLSLVGLHCCYLYLNQHLCITSGREWKIVERLRGELFRQPVRKDKVRWRWHMPSTNIRGADTHVPANLDTGADTIQRQQALVRCPGPAAMEGHPEYKHGKG